MSGGFDLKSRLQELGITPKKALGQNFLVSPTVIEKIISAVKARKFSDLVEIGPGVGALTERLLEEGFRPRLIELDRDLARYWRGRDLEVIEADALRLNWDELGLRKGSLLVSNLPYQISTHIVIDRCLGPKDLTYMILMFQKEVAERIQAKPRTKDYGMLSVMAQTHFKIARICEASQRDFYPPPKVASRVLSFERLPEVDLGPRFLRLLKAGFAFRRKFLLKNLSGTVDKSKLERLIPAKARAEELSPADWVKLYNKIYERD